MVMSICNYKVILLSTTDKMKLEAKRSKKNLTGMIGNTIAIFNPNVD